MNVLIVHASANTGFDPLFPALVAVLTAQGHAVTLQDASNRVFEISRDPTAYDLVLTVDASLWYIHNRLAIQGSYVAILASFCMGDLYHLLQEDNLGGLGVSAVFTNCYAYSQQADPGAPIFYVWKPVVPTPAEPGFTPAFPFGTVIPNIADRDFSLVQFVVQWLKKNSQGVNFPIYVPQSDRARLPAGLEENRVPVSPGSLFSSYADIRNYIPAVRITDYRAGIIPTELVQALASGVPPVLIAHPIILSLSNTVHPLFSSLHQLRGALPLGLQGKSMAQIHIKPELLPTPEKFVEQVLMVYKTWREEHADSGRHEIQSGSSHSPTG